MTGSHSPQLPETPKSKTALSLAVASACLDDMGKENPGFQPVDLVIFFSGSGYGIEAKDHRAGAVWRARSILENWASDLEDLRDRTSGVAEDLTRLLLRTAEEAPGVPCVTSGLLHGLGTAPSLAPSWVLDGQHRISAANDIIHSSMGAGKTEAFAAFAVDLLQRLGRARRAGPPSTAADLVHVVDGAEVLAEFLLELAQGFLSGVVRHVRYLVAVPPHQSSPCGVLRLAAPIIPGAPGQGPTVVPIDLALAA